MSTNIAIGQSYNRVDGILSDTAIYIFARGSKTKAGAIARRFNVADTLISHVGIGYVESGMVRIFNMVDDRLPGESALLIDTYESFIDRGTTYVSIWKADSTLAELQKLKKELAGFAKKNIEFDYLFELGSEKLYCSELCYQLLHQTNAAKYDYVPRVAELEEFHSTILGRKNLIYYPVDFFQQKGFVKVFEARIEKRD